MARIYYHKEKLSGQPIRSKIINVQQLDYILNSTDSVAIDLQEHIADSIFRKLFKHKINIFKKVELRRDDLHYESEKGTFFLPRGLIFFDCFDYNFPSEFFFIAKIGNKVEWRKCNGGKEVNWYHIPDLHQPLVNTKTIKKIESTFVEIKKLIAKKNIGKIKTAQKLDKRATKFLPISEVQKQAYRKLTELCVHNETDRRKINAYIKTFSDYKGDEDYLTTLNCFVEFLETEGLYFIIQMDWKAGIEDLEWLLSTQLKRQYNLNLKLPQPKHYHKMATITVKSVFEDFDRVLRQNGLQLGFIDTQSDEYVAVLHNINDKEAIQAAVNGIGYDYYEA